MADGLLRLLLIINMAFSPWFKDNPRTEQKGVVLENYSKLTYDVVSTCTIYFECALQHVD